MVCGKFKAMVLDVESMELCKTININTDVYKKSRRQL